MTYPLEKEGIIITNEEEFRTKICGTCRWKPVCDEWEFRTGTTLYSNRTTAGQPFVADDGTERVYRCSSFEGE